MQGDTSPTVGFKCGGVVAMGGCYGWLLGWLLSVVARVVATCGYYG